MAFVAPGQRPWVGPEQTQGVAPCRPGRPRRQAHDPRSKLCFVLIAATCSIPQRRSRTRRKVREKGFGSVSKRRPNWTSGLDALNLTRELKEWVLSLEPAVQEVIEMIEKRKERAWIVGGAVRDVLSGVAPSDVDIATTMTPEDIQQIFPDAITVGVKHGVITVKHKGHLVECATLRSTTGAGQVGESLLQDLSARDLTVNAMAVDLRRMTMFDPFRGRKDLKERVLRAVSQPADVMLRDDGLRVLRAYRFWASSAAWSLDPALAAALREATGPVQSQHPSIGMPWQGNDPYKKASKLKHSVNALGTTIEGPASKVWSVCRRAFDAALASGAKSELMYIKVYRGASTKDQLEKSGRKAAASKVAKPMKAMKMKKAGAPRSGGGERTAAARVKPKMCDAVKARHVGAKLLTNIARQRILQELKKILHQPRGAEVLAMMAEDGVLAAVLQAAGAERNWSAESTQLELRAVRSLWGQPEVAKVFAARDPSSVSLFPDPLLQKKPPAAKQPWRFYAVTDLEATCWDQNDLTRQEIIEFPVVLLDGRSGAVLD
ncbi:unnamed protein product, partial [Effrenium voratum]